MSIEIDEVKVGPDGIEGKLILGEREFKVTKLETTKELKMAHAGLCAAICCEFFELASMVAKEEGKQLCDFFESKEHLENSFKNYLKDFTETLVDNAVVHASANYALFEKQREHKKKGVDA